MKKKDEKNQCVCTCGSKTPCCVHPASQEACTCGTGIPCCVHEVEEDKQKGAKMYGGCCEPNCGPGVCK